MTVFGSYAQFYDILYQDKDYEAECDFLEQIFDRYAPGPVRTILDLGCGTGGHTLPLARRGYEVVGVDRSEKMLAEARRDDAPVFLGMHEQPVFRKMGLLAGESCPVAERVARRGLYIPSGLALADAQIERVADAVREVMA